MAELAATTQRIVERLLADQVRPGEAILYQGPQGGLAFTLFWAAVALGAVFVPLDQTWPEDLVRRAAAKLAPRVTIAPPERAALYDALFPAARRVSFAPAGAGDGRDWRRWLAEPHAPAPSGERPVQVGEDAPSAYLFTSGSTDIPKAVVLSRRALANSARLTVDCFGWRPGETLINAPEPHTMSGLRNGCIAAPLAGVQLRAVASETRAFVFDLLEALRAAPCQRLVVSPILIRQILMLGERVAADLFRPTKAVYCTGARLNPSDAAAFFDRFGAPVVNYYGLTESGGVCVSQRLADWRPDDASLGRAAGAALRVLGPDGRRRRRGEGELLVRSRQLMSGYLGDPQRTAARFSDGWLKTGDLVRIDADGRCYLVGRIETFLKSAFTDRLAPEEIEAVLERHPAVAEAAALGAACDYEGEQIVALVALRPGVRVPSAIELAAYVRARLGPARTPDRVQFVDRLPRGASGKISRPELPQLLSPAPDANCAHRP